MPNHEWNRETWSSYNWSSEGEEWSVDWGSSEAQWYGTIFPRLHRFLPAKSILEIAPGAGRWSRFLIPLCENFVGIDFSQQCIDSCLKRFSSNPNIKNVMFLKNDGYSLTVDNGASYDFIYSFDSLVHCDLDVIEKYIKQCIGKLKPGGVAFLHHSNLFEYVDTLTASGVYNEIGLRSRSVSADIVENIINENGGRILIQEKINWGAVKMTLDCITLFSKKDELKNHNALKIYNPQFMEEANIVRNYQQQYNIP